MKMAKLRSALGFFAAFALCIILIGLVAACAGCATDPATGDVTIRVPAAAVDFATNAVREYLEGLEEAAKGSAQADSSGAAESGPPATAEGEAATSQPRQEPEAVALQLDFRYGGFKGGSAKEDSRCRIGSPKITKDKISWKWETKIPSDWKRGSTSKGPMVISAAFYWDDSSKRWVGGKMDWCDEARTSRATGHIYGGYNGWKSEGWDKAKRRAFCVVSADGKWRSNLVED